MEFLDYNEALTELRASGLTERRDGDLVRFDLDGSSALAPEIHRVVFAPSASAASGETVVNVERDKLPDTIGALLHSLHAKEVMLAPVGVWRDVMDLTVTKLATEEAWLEIDAEASLHLNGRDPLLVEARSMRLVKLMASALLEHGDSPAHDLSILPTGTPMAIELACAGELRVWCASGAVADMLSQLV